MTEVEWCISNPTKTREIYEMISRRVFMEGWARVKQRTFQRKVVQNMAHDIIGVVVG